MTAPTKAERLAADAPISDTDRADAWVADAKAELRRLSASEAALLEVLESLMYWDNGKPEWDEARALIARTKEVRNG